MGRNLVVFILFAFLGALALAQHAPRQKYREKTAPEWARDLLTGDVAARRLAAYALWKLTFQEKGLGPILAQAVRDEDEYVRQTAAKAIPRLGMNAKAAVPGLVDALANDSPEVRREAMLTLYQIRYTVAPTVRPFVKALGDDDPVVRANAAGVIEYLGPAARELATEPLIRHLSDGVKDVRLWAARSLAMVNPAALVKPALARAKEGSAEERAEAFGQLGYARAAAKEAVPTLISALDENDPTIREAAVKALGVIDPVETVEQVATRLTDDDPKVRRAAAEALGYAGEAAKEQAAAVGKLLADEDVEVRRAAVLSLTVLGPSAAADEIIAALGDPDEQVRQGVMGCLARMGPDGAAAVPVLRKLLTSDARPVRTSAAMALGGIGEAAAVAAPDLVGLLDDPDMDLETRAQAARALGTVGRGSTEAVNALIRAIGDDNAFVREAAIYAISQFGPEAKIARGALVSLMENRPSSAYVAAQALGLLREGARPALPALRKAMTGGNAAARPAAALAIWRIDPEHADGVLPAFRKAFGDPSIRNTWFFQAQQEQDLIGRLIPDLVAANREDPTFALNSAAAISRFGDEEQIAAAVKILLGFVEGPQEQTWYRTNALSQLGVMGPKAKSAIPTLEKLVKDDDPQYSVTAKWALEQIRKKETEE